MESSVKAHVVSDCAGLVFSENEYLPLLRLEDVVRLYILYFHPTMLATIPVPLIPLCNPYRRGILLGIQRLRPELVAVD